MSGEHTAGGSRRLQPPKRDSFSRLAISDGLFAFGLLTLAAALIGFSDAAGDAVVMGAVAFVAIGIGAAGRRTFSRRPRPATGRVISGLASTWAVLVLFGAATYLATGAVESVDAALFEAASGFSTVALTSVDPSTLSLPLALFRASTQWLGGLVGLLAGVVAIPQTMKGRVQIPKGSGRRAERLAPSPLLGRRRVLMIYLTLTVLCGMGYLATGMSARGAAVHAMTTLSTGGFSDNATSFATESVGSRAVATIFMILAGTSYFALFWLIRGNVTRFRRSPELRLYIGIIVGVTAALIAQVDGLSVGDALFTAASASSTTGLAVTEWTLFPAGAGSFLLVAVATGAMGASAGSGLRVVRAWLLVLFAARELRGQLDPSAITVVKHAERPVGDEELDGLTGYQIAHFGLCAIGAFVLTLTGFEMVDSLWIALSVLSTFGPSPVTGAFGEAVGLSPVSRFLLIPGMLAGRLTILPLLLAVASVLHARSSVLRGVRRFLRPGR